ncbi:MAG: LysM peptidoglycan-binding domain-containing protein [Spirochaetaceae bacterium]|jgi:LysM repeat protein|nr:LysM peptidoglycan-binding domain-containing protein [Spirochaetaceae bacterium]
MAASIGIKEANGDFYPILEEKSDVKKRLVLTTVHDNQKSVQIDLYKSPSKSMADAMYIGSIVIENISLKQKGEPSIEMTISSTKAGSITADAVDLGNPSNEHHLSVHLESFEEDKTEYPDFEVDGEANRIKEGAETPERKFPWLAVIILGLVLALLCLGLWYLLTRRGEDLSLRQSGAVQTEAAQESPASAAEAPPALAVEAPAAPGPPLASPGSGPPVTAPPAPAAAPPPRPMVIDTPPKAAATPVSRERPSAPVYSFNVPQTIPPEGVAYKVRWGDTLWDISEAFYRNPRFYSAIVRFNEISNPNLIVSGTELIIPPRN